MGMMNSGLKLNEKFNKLIHTDSLGKNNSSFQFVLPWLWLRIRLHSGEVQYNIILL